MQYSTADLSVKETYQLMVQLITPRPIAWVSSISSSGVTNLAPYSFFNGVGANPPSVVFCPVNRPDGSFKDSLVNVMATGEFVVNLVSYDLADVMNQTSANYDAETSEFEAVGVGAKPSVKVAPPRVADSVAQLECQLLQVIHLAEGPSAANLVIGKIVMIHVDDDAITAPHRIDAGSLDVIGRLGGKSYTRTTQRFEIDRAK